MVRLETAEPLTAFKDLVILKSMAEANAKMKIGSKIKDIVIDSKNMDYNITDLPLTVQGLSLVKGIDQHIYRMYIKLDQKLINAHPNLAI